MSIQQDCYGCQAGEHDKHQWNWGLRPGLIGGSHCVCSGGCGLRVDKANAELNRLLDAAEAGAAQPEETQQ